MSVVRFRDWPPDSKPLPAFLREAAFLHFFPRFYKKFKSLLLADVLSRLAHGSFGFLSVMLSEVAARCFFNGHVEPLR